MNNIDRMIHILQGLRHHGNEIPPPEKLGISSAQVRIIDFMFQAEMTTVTEIAEGLGLTCPTVSVAVRKLEAAGMLKRTGSNDGRSTRLTLSAKGLKIRKRIHDFRTARVEAMLSGITPEEQETLLSLLEKIIS